MTSIQLNTPAIKGMGYELQSNKMMGGLQNFPLLFIKKLSVKFGSCELWPVLKTMTLNMCAMPFIKEQLTINMHGRVCLTSSFNRLPPLLHNAIFSFMGFLKFCLRLFIMRLFVYWKKWSPNQKQEKKKSNRKNKHNFGQAWKLWFILVVDLKARWVTLTGVLLAYKIENTQIYF